MFFKEQMKKRIKNEKGLTLIELLAVIVILAIIAAIAIPAIGNIIQKSEDKAVVSEALNVISGAKIAHTNGDCGAPVDGVVTCTTEKLNEYVDGQTLVDVTVTLTADDWAIEGYTPDLTALETLDIDDTNESTLKNAIKREATGE